MTRRERNRAKAARKAARNRKVPNRKRPTRAERARLKQTEAQFRKRKLRRPADLLRDVRKHGLDVGKRVEIRNHDVRIVKEAS